MASPALPSRGRAIAMVTEMGKAVMPTAMAKATAKAMASTIAVANGHGHGHGHGYGNNHFLVFIFDIFIVYFLCFVFIFCFACLCFIFLFSTNNVVKQLTFSAVQCYSMSFISSLSYGSLMTLGFGPFGWSWVLVGSPAGRQLIK